MSDIRHTCTFTRFKYILVDKLTIKQKYISSVQVNPSPDSAHKDTLTVVEVRTGNYEGYVILSVMRLDARRETEI